LAEVPERPRDDESVLRLVHPALLKNGQIPSAVFRSDEPLSMWIVDRLPNQDAGLLHVDMYRAWAAISMPVGILRRVSYPSKDDVVLNSFDLRMSPSEADPPLDIYKEAHATLEGSYTHAAPRALSESFKEHGVLRPPVT